MRVVGWTEGLQWRGRAPTGKAHVVEEWAGHGGARIVGCGARVVFDHRFFARAADAAPAVCQRCAARYSDAMEGVDHAGGSQDRSALP